MNYTETEIKEALKEGRLFAKTTKDISDGDLVYWTKDKEYEILGETYYEGECWNISIEEYIGVCGSIEISKDDQDFELIIKETL